MPYDEKYRYIIPNFSWLIEHRIEQKAAIYAYERRRREQA
jgi:hypothetical protein